MDTPYNAYQFRYDVSMLTAADIILEARTTASISQTELASRLDTHQSVVARWETGKTQPSFETVMRALAATGMELDLSVGAATPQMEGPKEVRLVVEEMKRLSQEQSRLRWIKGR